jgi:two-component system response regulator LytT
LADELKKLPDYFLQVHTSYVINMNAIKKSNGDSVIMSNDKEINISRKYVDAFRKNVFLRMKKMCVL